MFFGHGSPMNALEHNRYTAAWEQMGSTLRAAAPRAILMVSAHWYINAAAVTAMEQPRTIHDFFGFPQALFDVEYPAPGSAPIAEEVAQVVAPTWVGLDHDSWGLDHGTWSVLVHALPDATIPVIQLAIDATKPLADHLALGASLAPLLDQGVVIAASGNVVHNLGVLDWSLTDGGWDWAQRFEEASREVLTTTPGEAAGLASHPDFPAAVPTPDHFIPVLYAAGAAAAIGTTLTPTVEGYAFGSLSMTSYAA